ncbi:MAG TPA: ABC transporter permease subunit [Bryobacteraceae bacterium]|nr:ABC transporter permease subunit [Bryobacteraceae bacterium]
MRFPIFQAIYKKEMIDLLRDRRTLISMVVVPLLVFPLLFRVAIALSSRIEEQSEAEARTLGIAARVSTPSLREALAKTGYPVFERPDLSSAVEKKSVAAAVEEIPGNPPTVQIYVDSSNPTSGAAADRVRLMLDVLKEQRIRESLRDSGVPLNVLTPFTVKRTNVAGARKMAGSVWGSMLGYLLLLLMFTGGMYPVIDMTAGEKERKTLEAFLASPATRQEIVVGKTLAAMTAIFLTAMLTLGSMVYWLKNTRLSSRSEELKHMMDTIPLDAGTIAMIAAILIPVSIFAASLMFTIALFARSFKEGQSYLTPLVLLVIFPALMGGLPGFGLTPALCLIPIFNASMMVRSVLLGDASMLNFGVTLAANLVYAGIAAVIATRMFERENVLFRT